MDDRDTSGRPSHQLSADGEAEVLADALDPHPRPDTARRGWRRVIHRRTGGLITPGPSPDELAERELVHRLRRPEPDNHRIAVVSMKGGVGKTTVAACMGLVFAELRGDRVIALDANPDAGTLAERLTGTGGLTNRELLRDLDHIDTWSAVSRFTTLAGRLQVLASGQDPATSGAFTATDYRAVVGLLARFYNILITDSGTGMVHSAMEATLATADSLVVVGSPTVDGASRASKTLDWLHAHGHAALATEAVAVLTYDRADRHVDDDAIRRHFATRCRAVIDVPADPHLATGGRIYLDELRPRTHRAVLTLAAILADRFSMTGAHPAGPHAAIGRAGVPTAPAPRGPLTGCTLAAPPAQATIDNS